MKLGLLTLPLIGMLWLPRAPEQVTLCGERKSVGPCMPYAEKCLNCTDCSKCSHCSVKGGKCSVCWDKR